MPSHTIAQNLQRLEAARTNIASAITTKGGTVASGAGFEDFSTAIGTIPSGGSATLITKNIDANGTYNASSDSADGYSSVTVSVPNTYTASDEGKVVSNGALVAQTARPDTITTNGSYITTQYNSVTVNVPSSGGSTERIRSTKAVAPVGSRTWIAKTWSPNLSSMGQRVWTDGTDVFYNNSTTRYKLNRSTLTWESATWSGLTSFKGMNVWSDGTNIYYSEGYTQKVYAGNGTFAWGDKTWTGLTSFDGTHVWTDGTDIYYSYGSDHYVLDTTNNTWSAKTWTGVTTWSGEYVWTDGTNIYLSINSSTQCVLDKATSTWEIKTWNGYTNFSGDMVWSDGVDIYISGGSSIQYKLDRSNDTWEAYTWTGYAGITAGYVWTDGSNIFYGESTTNYQLVDLGYAHL